MRHLTLYALSDLDVGSYYSKRRRFHCFTQYFVPQTELAMDIEDQLETMSTNINYIQSNITDCQTSIMQMEEEAKVGQLSDFAPTSRHLTP